jgi:hypothetical protein
MRRMGRKHEYIGLMARQCLLLNSYTIMLIGTFPGT